MKPRIFLPLLLTVLAVMTAALTTAQAASNGAKNKDGSVVTGVLSARFDPTNAIVPFPTNLFFVLPEPTADLTLNIPVEDPTDKRDPAVALNSLDGFSTTERWVMSFSEGDEDSRTGNFLGTDGDINPDSVIPGQSVRVFQVTTQSFVFVTGIVRELIPGVDYTAAAVGGNLAIVPLQPLAEYSTFMAVVTNDITDMAGNNATPSRSYYLSQADTPWVDANGKSTYPLLDDATARGAESLRQITATMEGAAAAYGINPDDIVLSWTVQTQGVSPTLRLLRNFTQPAPVSVLPSGMDTGMVFPGQSPGFADISIGVITLPYYLGIPTDDNPGAPLFENWEAPPCGMVPTCAGLPLPMVDLESTNLTVANPIPVPTGSVTVPLLIGTPSAASGHTKPENGWPVVIYAHGITRNRTDALAIMDSIAAAGYAVVAMDHPLHGVVPEVEPNIALFKIDNHPVFGAIASERTFEIDFFNNETNLPPGDEVPDRSGQSYFNAVNLQAARDNLRQSQADLFVLAATLPNISVDFDQVPDFDMSNVGFVSHSYGVFIGVPFLAVQNTEGFEPQIKFAYLNSGGALLLRTGEAGAFGEDIRALLAGAGIEPGSPEFEQWMTAGQTVIGSADSASYAAEAAAKMPILNNTVIDDLTVPNFVPGQPMGGNEGLTRLLGLESFDSTQMNPEGLRSVSRFVPPAFHESFFRRVDDDNPDISAPEATQEMQSQMASFLVSGGTAVVVNDSDTLLPVVVPFRVEVPFLGDDFGNVLPVDDAKRKPGTAPVTGVRLD